MPKVSVLMPVFNNESFIKESIESILFQSFGDFEFIIVDDGSNDGTLLLLEEYTSKDRRIKVIRNTKNMGIVFSLNRGIKECTGEYIARMDSDDIAIKNRLEKQVAVMDSNPDILVLGTALSYVDALGNELGVIRYCELNAKLAKCPLLHPTVIIRRRVLDDYGFCYIEKYRCAEDYFLWLQISKIGRISAINDVLLKYRLNDRATKIKQLKKSLWATLKVKQDAIFILNITPNFKDLIIILSELILLLVPAKIVLFFYLRKTFGRGVRINL